MSKFALRLESGLPNLLFVRWKKPPKHKPMWELKRERKLFFIPVKPKFDLEESKEVSDRTKIFHTHMKSFKYAPPN